MNVDEKYQFVLKLREMMGNLFTSIYNSPREEYQQKLQVVSKVLHHEMKDWPSMPQAPSARQESYVPAAIFLSDSTLVQLEDYLRMPPGVDHVHTEWDTFCQLLRQVIRDGLAEAIVLPANLTDDRTPIRHTFRGFLEDEPDMTAFIGGVAETQERLDKAEKRWQELNSNVGEVSGELGQNEMAEHFVKHAKSDRIRADVMLGATVVLIVAVGIYLLVALNLPVSELSWLELVRRLALSLPWLGLAGYLAREASKHRAAANWAATISVQLRTVKSFTDPLPEDVRNTIRTNFAAVVFGQNPLGPPDNHIGALDVDATIRRAGDVRDMVAGQGSKGAM